MGRAPCCDKANVKKGPWSPEEDSKLKSYIEQHGTGGNWIALPQKIGLKRCGKSCRLRWLNYLRPNIKHGGFSEEEDNIICNLYISIGSRWSIIAAQLPGRTDNDIKNYWNTKLKKKLLGKQRKDRQTRGSRSTSSRQKKNSSSSNTNSISADDGLMMYQNTINLEDRTAYEPLLSLPPIPYSNEEPRFNDHASIRKLLIKLGGKFSDDHNQTMVPVGNDISPDGQIYDPSSHDLVAPNPLHFIDSNGGPQFKNMNGVDITTSANNVTSFLQGQNLNLDHNSSQQKLQSLEFFYEDIVFNDMSSGTATCGQSIDWGEMNSLVFPSGGLNNNEGFAQGIPTALEEIAIDKMSYPGATFQ